MTQLMVYLTCFSYVFSAWVCSHYNFEKVWWEDVKKGVGWVQQLTGVGYQSCPDPSSDRIVSKTVQNNICWNCTCQKIINNNFLYSLLKWEVQNYITYFLSSDIYSLLISNLEKENTTVPLNINVTIKPK